MNYNKNVYYLNTELKNKTSDNQEEEFLELVNLLIDNEESEIYEVGMEFGQRLDYIEKYGLSVVGGMEFDPVFSIYTKHVDLNNRGWKLDYKELEDFSLEEQKTIICYKLLENVDGNHQQLIEKIKNKCETLYIVTSLDLNLPKEGNVYVVTDSGWDDIESDTVEDLGLQDYQEQQDGLDEE
jgi:hypothetical protein